MNAMVTSNLVVRIADNIAEICKAQALRYRIFHEGMGATPSLPVRLLERDFDHFDSYCDHLIVIDQSRSTWRDPHVVGTYRLLRGTVADSHNGYYSSNEFELDRLARYPGEHLELGRSCVDPAYRNKAAMQLLWRGIADYIQQHDVSLLFGCASFPGTDVRQMASALAFLYHNHAAPAAWRPQARAERYLPMDLMEKDDIDMRSAMREMPALIKGYLRLGGVVGDGLVLDHTFNTTDIFLLVESCNLTSRYARHFMDQRVPEASQLTS